MWFFIVFSCNQLFWLSPWFSFWTASERVHLFCPTVLSVPIIQIVQHCFQIPPPLLCYKMILKWRVWAYEACFAAIPPLLVKFRQRGSYFHVISFKQPILNQSNSQTATRMPASYQRFQRLVHAIYLYMDTLLLTYDNNPKNKIQRNISNSGFLLSIKQSASLSSQHFVEIKRSDIFEVVWG